MNAITEPIDGQQKESALEEIRLQKLAKLRAEFDANHISKKPVPTRAQTDAVKANYQVGIRCPICKGWHHPQVEHLDYVGHAALTDRLLDVDPEWNWEPMAIDPTGLPMIKDGGMWIKLTVCGMTRLGYGSADGKTGGDAIKEIIGDALRNAGMRFGAALNLWHKGILHMDTDLPEDEDQSKKKEPLIKHPLTGKAFDKACAAVRNGEYTTAEIRATYTITEDQDTVLLDIEMGKA